MTLDRRRHPHSLLPQSLFRDDAYTKVAVMFDPVAAKHLEAVLRGDVALAEKITIAVAAHVAVPPTDDGKLPVEPYSALSRSVACVIHHHHAIVVRHLVAVMTNRCRRHRTPSNDRWRLRRR